MWKLRLRRSPAAEGCSRLTAPDLPGVGSSLLEGAPEVFSPPLLSGTGGTWLGWERGEPSGSTPPRSSDRPRGSDGREPSPLPGCGLPAIHPWSSGHILGNSFFFFLLPNSNLQGSSSFHFHPCVEYPRSMNHAGESRYFPGTVPGPGKHEVSQSHSTPGQELFTYFQLGGT